MRIPYASPCYGAEEIKAVVRVLENPRQIGAGPLVAEFEARIAELFAKPHGVMTNSGSSANLLALAALGLPRGSEVITPALTFSTTVAPILQLGLRPVFVDSEPDTYVVDVDAVRRAVTERTRALMIPLLLGNVPDMERLREIADERGLYLIEDSCDTLGARYAGQSTGAFADVSTTSFYATHVITCAGGGGLVAFREQRHAERACVLANWGRASVLDGPAEAPISARYRALIDGRPYDRRFTFLEVGYNLQATELQAAFGLAQLDRLPGFLARRRRNFALLDEHLRDHLSGALGAPHVHPKADPCWLAFPLRVDPAERQALAAHLESSGIQTRPIMAGNILRQPGFQGAGAGVFPWADDAMRSGLLVGCHQGLADHDITTITGALDEFVAATVAGAA
jgi:CDP-6-deoxy-D-xylo-4-hexulose-3-dehydrase